MPRVEIDTAIKKSKTFRHALDDILQAMKEHTAELKNGPAEGSTYADYPEVIAQHILSTRELEAAIMRQGMVLKNIGATNPYPHSKDPSSSIVDPTADGLKL